MSETPTNKERFLAGHLFHLKDAVPSDLFQWEKSNVREGAVFLKHYNAIHMGNVSEVSNTHVHMYRFLMNQSVSYKVPFADMKFI
jgi:hypothetical protein